MDDKKLKDFARRISNEGDAGQNQELIPAATVILLRDGDAGLETVMLRKNSKIAFGGMWVFPGGRLDEDDGSPDDEMVERARIAASREGCDEQHRCCRRRHERALGLHSSNASGPFLHRLRAREGPP